MGIKSKISVALLALVLAGPTHAQNRGRVEVSIEEQIADRISQDAVNEGDEVEDDDRRGRRRRGRNATLDATVYSERQLTNDVAPVRQSFREVTRAQATAGVEDGAGAQSLSFSNVSTERTGLGAGNSSASISGTVRNNMVTGTAATQVFDDIAQTTTAIYDVSVTVQGDAMTFGGDIVGPVNQQITGFSANAPAVAGEMITPTVNPAATVQSGATLSNSIPVQDGQAMPNTGTLDLSYTPAP